MTAGYELILVKSHQNYIIENIYCGSIFNDINVTPKYWEGNDDTGFSNTGIKRNWVKDRRAVS